MKDSKSDAYARAGVDITAGYRAVELMKEHVKRTQIPGVMSDIGGFGGLFAPDLTGLEEPILVSGTDGVGTKLKIAFDMERYDTVGIDCVAMCVNDIICAGAKPLFFLDYIACGKNVPEIIADLVKGVADGCVQAGCALIGGETAEMPGFYPPGEFDLAGFSTGLVDKKKILDPSRIQAGDVLLALPSSGLHSNGYSLVRKVLADQALDLQAPFQESGQSLGQVLLQPTKIYVQEVLQLLAEVDVKALANITGGGFYENIPRSLPEGLGAQIDRSALRIPPIFPFLQEQGAISDHDMFNTFNMGVGMVVILAADQKEAALRLLQAAGTEAYEIGEVVASDEKVLL